MKKIFIITIIALLLGVFSAPAHEGNGWLHLDKTVKMYSVVDCGMGIALRHTNKEGTEGMFVVLRDGVYHWLPSSTGTCEELYQDGGN